MYNIISSTVRCSYWLNNNTRARTRRYARRLLPSNVFRQRVSADCIKPNAYYLRICCLLFTARLFLFSQNCSCLTWVVWFPPSDGRLTHYFLQLLSCLQAHSQSPAVIKLSQPRRRGFGMMDGIKQRERWHKMHCHRCKNPVRFLGQQTINSSASRQSKEWRN